MIWNSIRQSFTAIFSPGTWLRQIGIAVTPNSRTVRWMNLFSRVTQFYSIFVHYGDKIRTIQMSLTPFTGSLPDCLLMGTLHIWWEIKWWLFARVCLWLVLRYNCSMANIASFRKHQLYTRLMCYCNWTIHKCEHGSAWWKLGDVSVVFHKLPLYFYKKRFPNPL